VGCRFESYLRSAEFISEVFGGRPELHFNFGERKLYFMISYQYLYLFIDFILFIIWGAFFIFRRDLHKELLSISLLIGSLTFLFAPVMLKDYWQPETVLSSRFSIEDFLFGFTTAGISAVIYEIFFGIKFMNRKDRKHHWSWFLFPLIGFNLLLFFSQINIFKINSIYAHITSLLIIALFFITLRKDLFYDSVISGLLFGVVYFIVFSLFLFLFPQAIQEWWKLNNISGLLIRGIPIEELLWAFSWGSFCGPFYEFFSGLKLRKV